MTKLFDSQAEGAGSRPPLVTRPLLLRFVSIIGASTSFYLLLSVVPLYAEATGGGRGNAAGLATGALMLATVGGELATPRLVARFGYRLVLVAGLLLLGVPAFALTASGGAVRITAVCLLRGIGFAFTVVAGGALTASLIPAERRGEGLALVGIVTGGPSLVALPLGVWLAAHVGYGPVFAAGAVAALAAVASVPGLPDRDAGSDPHRAPDRDAGRGPRDPDRDPDRDAGAGPGRDPEPGRPIGVVAGFRTPALSRPVLVFSVTALAAGILVTFLPLAVPSASGGVVATALFAQTAAATGARWVAGRHGDRHGPAALLVPGLVVAAGGTLLVSLTHSPVAVVIGVALFGIGFGVTQNTTLTLMYARVPASGYGTVSALWNFAFDAGMGVGAVGFGFLAGRTGYPWAFALTAVLMLTALAPARRDRRTEGPRGV
ncbi:MFS transporter [Streptomyces litmocidini]|uniref:MFS transporter n=1 Tax=Streptomyces litmocidini TaxID=67318 RepID=UPI0019BBD3EF|nr:MFS transporter [Streptomyces litmocidini]GGU96013.1 MFS transporter [Streptomyces litmocidini]